jgi:N-acetyl sugar amidotransferase
MKHTKALTQKEYQVCKRCVMDTSDPQISFDERGYCNHCLNVETVVIPNEWFFRNELQGLDLILKKIKKDGEGKPYDCLIGLSGGVDSSYLAYLVVKKFGLRPLAVHVDAGWNSETAVHNIEMLVRKLNLDLYTEVIDWEEVQDLQRAYIRAGVANQDVPQDHAFFTILYQKTHEYNIKYFLSGGNCATESILPTSWGYNAMDATNIKSIHSLYGQQPLKTYPLLTFFKRYFYYRFVSKINIIRPLNYIPYNRDEAIKVLEKEMGWKNYGDKHHESRWTRWFQSHYLPSRFGFDKRKAHLSSMVMSGEITRKEALDKLKQPLYDENTLRIDEEFIIKKLNMEKHEFYECLHQKRRSYADFKNQENVFKLKDKIKGFFNV